ncbi:hypothetical protein METBISCDRAFT_25052 [Metschnikowia bicuspidata]|uniref:GAF domain-containing protein n=1 Tax=Metschnikowia bicuspidata TaxID=27322 RepID=A0A4P9Z707_9ASCO|nr:hypothetical protein METBISCDRAFT_25052 [Metschnikowia bicuspidata]
MSPAQPEKHPAKAGQSAENSQPAQLPLLAPYDKNHVYTNPLTVAHFVEKYSLGGYDLSKVACPLCLPNKGFFEAPDAHNEQERLQAVKQFLSLKQWEDRQMLLLLAKEVRKCVGSMGMTVSLVHRQLVYFKFKTHFAYQELPREVLIDAHTILSHKPFVVPDTHKDWRTATNPLVTGDTDIRFYCGVPLVTRDRAVVGALSVFDYSPNTNVHGPKLERLEKLAEELVSMLESPFHTFLQMRNALHSPCQGQVAADLLQLSTRLGRATCKGGYMTVFERDGSGSPYSLNCMFNTSDSVGKAKGQCYIVPTGIVTGVQKVVERATSLQNAFELAAKAVVDYFLFEFVCVMEVRFTGKYLAPTECFEGITKVELDAFEHKAKLAKDEAKTKLRIRTLAQCGGSYDVESTDVKLWQKAYSSDYGLQARNPRNNAHFNHALLMLIFRMKPSLSRDKHRQNTEDTCSLVLRSGGYLLGVFSKSKDTFYDSGKLARVYEHMRLVHKEYSNKQASRAP